MSFTDTKSTFAGSLTCTCNFSYSHQSLVTICYCETCYALLRSNLWRCSCWHQFSLFTFPLPMFSSFTSPPLAIFFALWLQRGFFTPFHTHTHTRTPLLLAKVFASSLILHLLSLFSLCYFVSLVFRESLSRLTRILVSHFCSFNFFLCYSFLNSSTSWKRGGEIEHNNTQKQSARRNSKWLMMFCAVRSERSQAKWAEKKAK